jgi:hydrogenase maturation protease
MKSKILIVGVGNPLRHDDGIGCEIIKILRIENNSNFTLLDAGTDGFVIFDQLPLYKKVIIIDAVSMGENSGAVKLFTPPEAKLKIKNDALSTHGFGLAQVLKLVEALAIATEIKIIGMQPQNINFGEGLSDVVKDGISQILDLIKKEVSCTI